MIYSHTNFPNRYSCAYSDIGQDSRATITLVNASSLHPGGVNVLFMDGSVRFIKSSIGWQAWYAIATPNLGEAVSSDQLSEIRNPNEECGAATSCKRTAG